MTEATIVAKLAAHIKSRGGYCIKHHGSAYSHAGTPDLLACLDGRFLALEVKRPGKRATRLQAVELGRWAAAGAVAGVVTSVEELEALLSDSPTDEQKALSSNPRAVDNKREGV